MKKFIALVAAGAFVVATAPAKPALAGDNSRAIIAGTAIIAGAVVAASNRHHSGYRTGGGYYVPPRYAVPPQQRPPYGYGYYPREPHVFSWRRQFYAPQQCCRRWTTYGWVVTPGPCPTFRAYGGAVRQRPGYPY